MTVYTIKHSWAVISQEATDHQPTENFYCMGQKVMNFLAAVLPELYRTVFNVGKIDKFMLKRGVPVHLYIKSVSQWGLV